MLDILKIDLERERMQIFLVTTYKLYRIIIINLKNIRNKRFKSETLNQQEIISIK